MLESEENQRSLDDLALLEYEGPEVVARAEGAEFEEDCERGS